MAWVNEQKTLILGAEKMLYITQFHLFSRMHYKA